MSKRSELEEACGKRKSLAIHSNTYFLTSVAPKEHFPHYCQVDFTFVENVRPPYPCTNRHFHKVPKGTHLFGVGSGCLRTQEHIHMCKIDMRLGRCPDVGMASEKLRKSWNEILSL